MRLRTFLLGCAMNSASALQSPLRRAGAVALKASPTEVEAAAASSFKMITEEEASIRKAGGVVIGVATAAAFATGFSPSYGSLAGGIFAAVSTFRTGSEYQ